MAMKAALSPDEHAKLPEAERARYRAEGDLFVLDIEEAHGWAMDRPAELKAALRTERSRNEAARKLAEVLGDVDPRAAKDAYGRVAELEEKLRELSATREGKLSHDVEARVAKATEKLTAELGEVKKQAESYRASLITRGLRDELRSAIRKAEPDVSDVDAVIELILPHVERRTATEYNGSGLVVKVVGSDGKPDISGKPGSTAEKSLVELIGEMKTEQPFARVFSKPGAEGFRGRTSPQPAGSRARTVSVADNSHPEREPRGLDLLRAANSAAAT
jgi:hypothetical protein